MRLLTRLSRIASLAPLCLTLVLATGSIACGDAARDAGRGSVDSLAFEDDLGRTIRLAGPAQRVVPLAPNLTEIAFAAGAGERVVGVGRPDDFPPTVAALPRFSTLPLDFEAIAALQPDLALATDQVNNPRDAETLEALGIHTAFFTFDGVADVFDAVENVGRLAGTSAVATRAADSLRNSFQQLRDTARSWPDHPRVLFLIGDETLYAFGRHSYVQDIIHAAGGESLTADIDRRAPVLSEEFVLEEQPDVIIGAWGPGYDTGRLADLHPAWSEVPAIRNGRVHTVDPDLFLRPGPRVVEGARRLAALLHPDHFAMTDSTDAAT